MKRIIEQKRILLLAVIGIATCVLFLVVVVRSGPLSPIAVKTQAVTIKSLQPKLFGIGTIEARYNYRIGPIAAGRVKQVYVQVGDRVRTGQVVAEIDPVDLDARISAQIAAAKRAEASLLAAEAQLRETASRTRYAELQAQRYEQLVQVGAVSKEAVDGKQQDQQVARSSQAAALAARDAASQELVRSREELRSIKNQRGNLILKAPADGLVTLRDVDPGTTVVAGQTIVEIIAPDSIWMQVRFEQSLAGQLRSGLPAEVALRSRPGQPYKGAVTRIEPKADAVTEESVAKVAFSSLPSPAPAVGEMVEVIVTLPALPDTPVVPNSAVKRYEGQTGVWVLKGNSLEFRPVSLGSADLDGLVQVTQGLQPGEQVVTYSRQALKRASRVRPVEHLDGTGR